MDASDLEPVGGQDHAELIGIDLGLRRQAVANREDITRGGQKSVGLIEEGVLPSIESFVKGGDGIEVERDVVERNAGLVVLAGSGNIRTASDLCRASRARGP